MASERLDALRQRLTALRLAFARTRAVDPKLVPLLAGVALGMLAVCTVVGALVGRLDLGILAGVLLAALAALVIFGRRASTAAIGSIEGQPGAAAAVLQSQRGVWRVQPAVAITRKQDFVHRAVGRPGIVLVGEGSRARVTSLLKQEARKVARVAGDTPVHQVSVGDGDGQVPLRQLQGHLAKLPRKIKPAEVGALERRLGSLASSDVPMPKGPVPRGGRRA